MATHEDFSRAQQVKASSNRAFGWTFVAVFLIVGLWPLGFGGGLRWWSVVVGAIVMLATLAMPALLTLPNRLWLRFGALLHRLVSPIVLAFMFYVVITPMGLLMRAFGKDLLRLRRGDPSASYWLKRDPPGPKPSSMSKQF
jgi:saxitoxin biosynthesis operon SxtJ-like protein